METEKPVQEDISMYQLIADLQDESKRENALAELSKKRTSQDELAKALWNSFGTMTILLEEIVSSYPLLDPPRLTQKESVRLCNVLVLLQTLVSSPETYLNIIQSSILVYIYPIIKTSSKKKTVYYARLTGLGVIGAISKMESNDVIPFFLKNDVIGICLTNIENGSILEQTIATFILQKITQDSKGSQYINASPNRLQMVCNTLSSVIEKMDEKPDKRLLKHVVRCFLSIVQNPATRDVVAQYYPKRLSEETFTKEMEENTSNWHHAILDFIAQKK
ncbi:hypothetical protein WA158_003091 [Blastocystis sp. Blastoise]